MPDPRQSIFDLIDNQSSPMAIATRPPPGLDWAKRRRDMAGMRVYHDPDESTLDFATQDPSNVRTIPRLFSSAGQMRGLQNIPTASQEALQSPTQNDPVLMLAMLASGFGMSDLLAQAAMGAIPEGPASPYASLPNARFPTGPTQLSRSADMTTPLGAWRVHEGHTGEFGEGPGWKTTPTGELSYLGAAPSNKGLKDMIMNLSPEAKQMILDTQASPERIVSPLTGGRTTMSDTPDAYDLLARRMWGLDFTKEAGPGMPGLAREVGQDAFAPNYVYRGQSGDPIGRMQLGYWEGADKPPAIAGLAIDPKIGAGEKGATMRALMSKMLEHGAVPEPGESMSTDAMGMSSKIIDMLQRIIGSAE